MDSNSTPANVGSNDGLGPDATYAELWAEIYRLRAAVAGPRGYESWQEAATAERMRRVRKEQQVETLLRGMRCIASAITDCQFTGPNAALMGHEAVPLESTFMQLEDVR